MKRSFLILFIFMLSFIIVSPVEGAEASLYLSPDSGRYSVGSVFSVKLKVNSDGAPINAAKAKISFSTDLLEVKSVSKTGSIFQLWPKEPVFSNSNGEISFGGGVPAPGFTGIGTILTVSFKTREAGEAKVSLSEAAILAADGRGTDILTYTKGGNFSIIEEVVEITKVPAALKISSSTHLKENFWYNNPNPKFQWKISPDIIGINYKLDQNLFSIPEPISKTILKEKVYEKIEDGIWYFHLRVQNKIGWSKTSHFKIQIDTQPPEPFDIVIDDKEDPTNAWPMLYFEAQDTLSGISHYEIRIGQGDIFSIVLAETNPFQMPYQNPGPHEILVKAVDKAGNNKESSTVLNVESISSPEILIYPKIYTAGEEIFYVEGVALTNSTVILFFKRDESQIKIWETPSDENGSWSFSTDELFKTGNYLLSARTKDSRGVISNSSPEYPIKVVLVGIAIGPWLFSYQILFLILITLIFLFGGIIIYLILSKIKRLKERTMKETREAAESLKNTFNNLRKEIEEKIEYFDSKPGLNPEERKLRDELMDILKKSEETVRKEIKDIEKELK